MQSFGKEFLAIHLVNQHYYIEIIIKFENLIFCLTFF
jgi:hypothetical protein